MPESPDREARRSGRGWWLAAAVALTLAVAALSCRSQSGPLADPNTALTPETHTFFPIADGGHAGIDCNTCHGAFDSFQEFDCLTCHTQPETDPIHAGMPGYEWTSQRCLTCHPDGTAYVDHTLFFPINAGATHENIPCATCHVDPGDRKVFDCLGCHTQPETDPWHTGVPDYAWSSPQCYACHPSSNIPDFPHPAFPTDSTSAHKDTRCNQCHVDQANLRTINCVSCHPGSTNTPLHGNVGGFNATSNAGCLRCHGDSQVNRVLAHLPFVISSGAHFRESCVRCHPAYRTDKPFAANFGASDCFVCHAGIHDNRYTSSVTCLQSQCHPDGRKP